MSPAEIERLLAFPGRPTRALIDLDALRRNASVLRARLDPGTELMAVVKADGYGHGALMVAREAIAGGATRLGVATVAEGAELRESGIQRSILILGPIDDSELDRAVQERLEITAGDDSVIAAIETRATSGRPVPTVHLKIDTGMHRLGIAGRDGLAALRRLTSLSPSQVAGLSTHLSCADEAESPATDQQVRDFREIATAAAEIQPGIEVHVANSSGTLAGLAAGTQVARVGIALYGCGVPDHLATPGLTQSMSLVSRLARVHRLGAGDGVSYGRTYVAADDELVGLAPIGYADGYPRSLSNVGRMRVNGVDCPVRGRVCMDQTVVGDLPDGARTGDPVGVIGPALEAPSWDQAAEDAGTISYELLTRVGRRVVRLYHRGGRLEAARNELGRYTGIVDDNDPDAACDGVVED